MHAKPIQLEYVQHIYCSFDVFPLPLLLVVLNLHSKHGEEAGGKGRHQGGKAPGIPKFSKVGNDACQHILGTNTSHKLC
jgi:hypothetical protein